MNKKLLNAFLCGVAILSMSVFNSCKTDLSDLEGRMRVIETAIVELQNQLNKAVMNGHSIVSYTVNENTGVYTLTLSNNEVITINAGSGGGSNVSVNTTEAGFVTITVNGEDYRFAVGSAVSSLVYRPEFEDGEVLLGGEDVNVKFLATPAISADAVAAATVKVADVYELSARTRAGDQVLMSVVGGKATLDGEYISVPLRALEVTAGKLYSVSIQMSVSGTTISSDYFPVRIADDYEAKPEELDETIIPIADYSPVKNEDKSYTITVNGAKMLQALNVKDFYGTTVPAGATFKVAPAGKQPEGDAQSKQSMLAASLAADGTWEFTERPGTDFGATGFQIEVLVNDEVKARTNIVINDPLKDVDFAMANANGQHLEINRDEPFHIGVNTYDVAVQINNDNFSERHGTGAAFIESFKTYTLMAGDEMILMNDGTRLVVTEDGQKYTKNSRGLVWLMAQTSIAASQGVGGNGEIIGGWDGITGEDAVAMGLELTSNGIFNTTAAYGGWALRLGFGIDFEYAYGSKRLGWNIAFIWFNRRTCDEGVVDPSPR